jgi:hypothetical protein
MNLNQFVLARTDPSPIILATVKAGKHGLTQDRFPVQREILLYLKKLNTESSKSIVGGALGFNCI